MLALTKCLALELVGDGITVVAISPGFYATDLTAPLRADAQKNAALMAATPAARWGKPEEIGGLARYICTRRRVVHDRHRHPHGWRLGGAVRP